ncbi:hypothetical_protein [Candidozyma auris]|uniref:hypothetical_protein n=1 Tax=Candidozyma auris TaxID=498019 RepID=UPI000D29D537|nr:hypothetical_protein [[Candida] auris]QEO19239.1 hypothetical_protein [[Candida] auris]
MSVAAPPQRLRACQRCRSRKTRCDHTLPSCSSCAKAGVPCMSDDKASGRTLTRAEAWALEQRIKTLSESIQAQDNIPNSTEAMKSSADCEPTESKKRRLSEDSSSSEELDSGNEGDNSSHYNGLHLLGSVISDNGSSHVSEDIRREIRRYSHSMTPQGARETFIATENLAIGKLGRDFLKASRKNIVRNRATDITAYNMSILSRVSRRYFSWFNSAYPVMHEKQFSDLLQKCHDSPDSASALSLFQVRIVIAISLASISRPHLSTSELGHSSHAFWKSATRLLSRSINEASGIVHLQISLLLLQYTLLVPKAGNLWQLAGSAMRIATELGYYAEPTPGKNLDPLTLDLRRRLFWTCYCIDRTLSTIMGRPTSIPDAWITAEMPSLVEDALIRPDGVHSGPTCHLKIASIHHVHICRLQSEIHGRLYAPGHNPALDPESLSKWTWHTYDQLRAWRSSHLYPTPLITREWTEFQFHIAVVLLLRPSPNRANPTLEELHVAFHSAGQAMNLVKIMHREASAVFAWLTVQSLFMCGLTYIRYLRTLSNANQIQLCKPFVEIILEVQACSSMLETLAALDSGDHEQIRNVFEVASSNVLHELANSCNITSQANKGNVCIWDRLAKSSSPSLQRPINIPGCSPVELQRETNIHLISKLQERDNSLLDDDHFFHHDVDAYPSSGYSHRQDNSNDLHVPANPRSWRQSEEFTSVTPFRDFPRDDGLERGFTSQPTPGPFASPMQDSIHTSGLVPDIPDDTSADLERWFLYPI